MAATSRVVVAVAPRSSVTFSVTVSGLGSLVTCTCASWSCRFRCGVAEVPLVRLDRAVLVAGRRGVEVDLERRRSLRRRRREGGDGRVVGQTGEIVRLFAAESYSSVTLTVTVYGPSSA